jgi:hypothetical protein
MEGKNYNGCIIGRASLRFPDIALAIQEVGSESFHANSRLVRLGSHEEKHGLENLVGELTIVRPHALPQVVQDVFDWDAPVWQDIAAGNGDQVFVVGGAFVKRHVLEKI